eukprot:TRINITY_DN4481_c0_g1_i1.p1 TRINITY_DN4481_c0_g1~~TRINITY_DN4481_c0_g1_i1.p1  ORF type:complete len:276 (-),score=72.18 TRINITY_DN4481_c0_g1_i1:141-968(-)
MPPDSSVEESVTKSEKLQKWLDQNQYSRKGILRYEKIFGRTYVSVGGEYTTSMLTQKLDLQRNQKVLDIGCGTGGSAFYMARRYEVDVHGVDLSTNMVAIATDYRTEMEAAVKHRVQFYVEDAVAMEYPKQFYDIVYSRDTILHIKDKLGLFQSFNSTLKSGGKLLITDYCKGDQAHSEEFIEYVKRRDYELHTVKEYGNILQRAGFVDVEALDVTNLMTEMLETELERFDTIREDFMEEFSQEDFQYIRQGWVDKIKRTKAGDQAWGLFTATKP